MKHYETPQFLALAADPAELLTASTPVGFQNEEEGGFLDEMIF